jgi:hypothetical protein
MIRETRQTLNVCIIVLRNAGVARASCSGRSLRLLRRRVGARSGTGGGRLNRIWGKGRIRQASLEERREEKNGQEKVLSWRSVN